MTQVPRELWPLVCRLGTSGEWPPRSDADVDAFIAFANLEQLLPLLMDDTDLPPQILAAKPRFRALAALYRKRYELSRAATLELLRVLGADRFFFFKGADYRHRLYDRPDLRPMADVDIFIPPEDFAAALRQLAAAGYPRQYTDHGVGFAPGHHEASVFIGSVHVEPHRSFGQRVRAGVDYDGMWRRREWFEHDGIAGYRLSPADVILAHAFHLAIDEFSSQLVRYVDLYLLLQRHEHELRECVTRANAWQIERPLFGALHLLATLFPSARTRVVMEAMDQLLDPGLRRFLVDRVLPDLAKEPSGHVTGRRLQLWRKYALMDRHWRRIAFFAYHGYETAIGSIHEWRASQRGVPIPPRSTTTTRYIGAGHDAAWRRD